MSAADRLFRLSLAVLPLALAGAVAVTGATPALGAYAAHSDIDYDQGSPVVPASQNRLDLYQPLGFAGSRPVVAFVHGGGWRAGDKGNQIARKRDLFTGAGYVFASLNYRLSPNPPDTTDPARVMFPDHPHDVGEAVGWLHRNVAAYGGDPRRIILIGHSAGAHLTSLLGTFPGAPAPGYLTRYGVGRQQVLGVISLDTDAFDVADRIAEAGPAGRLTFHNAFGTPQENALSGAWRLSSPQTWAGPEDPPFLVVTQANSANRIADSRTMLAALGQKGDAGLLTVPLSHAEINDALGDPADSSAETATVMSFVSSLAAAARPGKPRLRSRPKRRVAIRGRRAKVRFSFKLPKRTVAECRLDRGPYERCRSPRAFRVVPGRHTIRVRARGAVFGKAVGTPSRVVKAWFRVARRR